MTGSRIRTTFFGSTAFTAGLCDYTMTCIDIGEIVVVVTCYFGGIKLGTGDLVRAYSSSVQMALQKLPLAEFVTLTTAQITLPFPFENRIRRLLEKMKVTITEVKYRDQIVLLVEFPAIMVIELEQQIGNQTQGQAQFIGLTG